MQTIIEGADLTIIKWLVGCIGFLIVFINSIIAYFFSGIHKMIKDDHELVKSIFSEHKLFHDSKINGG